jgi:5-formyltetrahydrofolate cyclo-ligase
MQRRDAREIQAEKQALREEIWEALQRGGAARFPGANGRIPNFRGAEAAAARLRDTDLWRRARTLKANPDSPQLSVRANALQDGKRVYMAVPRLAGRKPFLRLDPSRLEVAPRRAASIRGASEAGTPVDLSDMEVIDLVVCGCVAVDPAGARLGKGGGYSDLEYALACEAGRIGPKTAVATTVHEIQIVAPGRIPVAPHDFRLDWIVTPERCIPCSPRPRPGRARGALLWERLEPEKIRAIPVLGRLARERGIGG